MGVIFLPVLVLFTYTTGVVLFEIDSVLQTYDFSYIEDLSSPVLSAENTPSELLTTSPEQLYDTNGVNFLTSIMAVSISYFSLIASIIIDILLIFVLTFYLLRDGSKLRNWITVYVFSQAPGLDEFIDEIDTDLQSIFFGNILNAMITAFIGVVLFTGLTLIAPDSLRTPYPALLGMLCGIGSLIPVVGTKIVYGPYGVYIAFQSLTSDANGTLWFPVALILTAYVFIDTIPDIGLRPYVSGRRIHIGPLMVTYIVSPVVFGWYGLFLGPIIFVAAKHFVEIILPNLPYAKSEIVNKNLINYKD